MLCAVGALAALLPDDLTQIDAEVLSTLPQVGRGPACISSAAQSSACESMDISARGKMQASAAVAEVQPARHCPGFALHVLHGLHSKLQSSYSLTLAQHVGVGHPRVLSFQP